MPGRPGVTTDGSELYPEPLKELWPDVPHQVCEFHVIKEITKRAARLGRNPQKTPRPHSQAAARPTPQAERAQSRKATQQQQQVSKLYEHRYLFVQHRLPRIRRQPCSGSRAGWHTRRLRQIMEEVYRLFTAAAGRRRGSTAQLRRLSLKRLAGLCTAFQPELAESSTSRITNHCRRAAMR